MSLVHALPHQHDLFVDLHSPDKPDLWADAWSTWLEQAQTSGRLRAGSSVEVYRVIWFAVADHLKAKKTSLGAISVDDLAAYLGDAKKRKGGISDRFAQRVLRLVDSVMSTYARQNDLEPNNAAQELLKQTPEWRFAGARVKQPLPDFLAPTEANKLIAWLTLDHENWRTARNAAAVALHLGAGLTSIEVRNLIDGDIDFQRSVVRVSATAETSEREAPMATWAADVVMRWSKKRKSLGMCGDSLLPAKLDSQSWGKVSHHNAVKTVLEAAGIECDASAFTLRHTFALRQLQTTDASKVQRWLGIEDAETMLRYTRVIYSPQQVN